LDAAYQELMIITGAAMLVEIDVNARKAFIS
jgi:hypothetical protein